MNNTISIKAKSTGISLSEEDRRMAALPEEIRNYLRYEAICIWSTEQITQLIQKGYSTRKILRLIKASEDEQTEIAYGKNYPIFRS